jgi:hypothetical protein
LVTRAAAAAIGLPTLSACSKDDPAASGVRIVPTPGTGIVPAMQADSAGLLHVVYLQGADLFHCTSSNGGASFGEPMRINDQAGFADGGLFRGPKLVLGEGGALHVVWYSRAWSSSPDKTRQGAMYSRAASGQPFAPARNVGGEPSDGFSIAVNGQQVAVAWHNGEVLKVARSTDAGSEFAAPQSLAGALPCECCDTWLQVERDGRARVVYRDRQQDRRDMFLATMRSDGNGERQRLDRESWILKACPISGCSAVFDGAIGVVAWERDGRILATRIEGDAGGRTELLDVGGGKYPMVLRHGEHVLVAWCDGGALSWQRFDWPTLRAGAKGSVRRRSMHRAAGAVAQDGQFVLMV